MNVNALTQAVDALRNATTDALAPVATEITSAARQAGILVLPAALDIDGTVVLDEKRVHVTDVVAAAVACGSALLYLHHEMVEPTSAATTIQQAELPPDADTARRAMLRELERVDGWTSEIELGFVDHGVMVVWAVTADWADPLREVTQGLRQRTLLLDVKDTFDDDEPTTRLDDAAITALATKLAAIPEFRRARHATERTNAAQQVPELAQLQDQTTGGWQVHSVIRTATELVQEQVAACQEQLKPRRTELASALATDPEFRSIRTADARQKFTAEWLLDYTDNLRLPSWWIKELVAEARSRPDQPTL